MQGQGKGTDGDLTVAVVVAGGRSRRFGGSVPKQFLELCGRSVLDRAIASLTAHPRIDGVVVVLPRGDGSGPTVDALRRRVGVLAVVEGGETRARSVRAGLAAVERDGLVLVHDAARPLLPRAVVERVLVAARDHGAAIPVVPVADSLVRVDRDGVVAGSLGRSDVAAAQTPQAARRAWLIEALERAEADGVEPPDEASALRRAGRRVVTVAGDPVNFKITTGEDLANARRILEGRGVVHRVGHGFDVHRFASSPRELVLGGIRFAGERGLEGHSDADVVLHAAMDALLGAAGLADIGAHFPDDDPRFRGAASTDLAGRIAARVREAGYRVANVDLTVLAETPRIATRRDEMRAAVARALAIEPSRVGLKATTLEGLGALGRGDGIACHAVALLVEADDGE